MSTENPTMQLLQKFIDGVTKSEGAMAQMVHQHQDPRFIPIRNKLTLIKKKCLDIAIKASGVTCQTLN